VALQPHGIYIHHPDNTLYVVSHAMEQGGERVEVFDIITEDDVPASLKYKHSITFEDYNSDVYGILNSIAVVSPNEFYVTKYKPYAMAPHTPELSLVDRFIKAFNNYGFFKRTHVLYCSWNGKL